MQVGEDLLILELPLNLLAEFVLEFRFELRH